MSSQQPLARLLVVKLHIGIDDTDSKTGGCTTYVAALLVERFSQMRVRFTDYPNIVRLNPNIPYKTRGNAAVALRLQVPDCKYEAVREAAIRTVEENSKIGEEATDPAVVLLGSRPSRAITRLSRKALTGIVSVPEAVRALRGAMGSAVSYGSGMGIVGALAAVGQTLDEDHTYELIAYRCRRNLGKPRLVDEESVIRMDRLTSPNTFNNYDNENKRVLITPHGPDPVLLGLRGETPEAVRTAFGLLLVDEPIERWVIFRTNHGTDAHFHGTESRQLLRVNRPVRLRGVVYEIPKRIRGGHVFLKLLISRRVVECAAFEPTGRFKEVVAKLIPGDKVTVFGGVRRHEADYRPSLTVNLEKIMVDRLVEDIVTRNPRCPRCEKRMKSAGQGQGFRCPVCKYELPDAAKQILLRSRAIRPGLYVPDRKAHRHLTKPLARYGLEKKRWDGGPPVGRWHEP
jgi:tRNA(Ile2)-agmatinylcytidine synthase